MQNKDIKRRIEQLAKQSNQLKKVTFEGADSSRITNIINQSKRNLQNDWYNSQNTNSKYLKDNKVQQKEETNTVYRKQILQQKVKLNGPFRFAGIKTSGKAKTFEENISLNKLNYRVQEEILLLRQQNARLQRQNRNLRNLLQQRQKQNGSPFFKFSQQIDLFYTRIFVRVQDYDKIDFNKYTLKLQQTTLYINKTNQSSPWKILALSQIKIVKYLGQMIMIEFQSHIGTQYLFIQYKDNEQQKKWDLALYINKFIKQCEMKINLFIQEPQIKTNLKPRKYSANLLFNQKYKASINDQHDYYNTKKQIQKSTQYDRLNHRENTLSSMGNTRRQKSQTSQSSLSKKYQIQKTKLDDLFSKSNRSIKQIKDTNKIDKIDKIDQEIIQKRRQILDNKSKKLQNIAQIQWIQPTQQIQKNSVTPKSLVNTQQRLIIKPEKQKKQETKYIQNLQQKNNINQQKMTVVQQPSAFQFDNNTSHTNLDKSQQIARNKVIQSLKKPKNFLKYAKGGFRPRDKQVYLSENETQLCWKDYQTKKIGKIKIQDITQIQIGVLGPGMTKQSKNLNPDLCLIIKTNERILQLSAQRKDALDKFANQIGFLLQQYQQGSV